jgi:SAM-dependent methyltransferase
MNDIKTLIQPMYLKLINKIVLSKPSDAAISKTVGKLFSSNGHLFLQFETFFKDGKNKHLNADIENAAEQITAMIENDYKQADMTFKAPYASVHVSIMRSKNGKINIAGNVNELYNITESAIPAMAENLTLSHNRKKNYLLSGTEPFLMTLGICDSTGRVFDKKQAKFRQINKFLECIEDIYENIKPDGIINIYDLCCGKSYLTFAVYHYFTQIKKRSVNMVGADLKRDVIEFCAETAEKLHYADLTFICGDISDLQPSESGVDLVISLHACDTATDVTLAFGVKNQARVILSTPCCQHEMYSQMPDKIENLDFITEYGIFKHRFCDIATDALRCLRLEIENYNVTATEFIDPDETPKNLLIRAVKNVHKLSDEKESALRAEYGKVCKMLDVSLCLDKMI